MQQQNKANINIRTTNSLSNTGQAIFILPHAQKAQAILPQAVIAERRRRAQIAVAPSAMGNTPQGVGGGLLLPSAFPIVPNGLKCTFYAYLVGNADIPLSLFLILADILCGNRLFGMCFIVLIKYIMNCTKLSLSNGCFCYSKYLCNLLLSVML